MKRAIAFAMVFAFVLTFAASVFALPEPINKLKGGVEAVIKSPLELPKATGDEIKSSDFKPYGLVYGLMKGTYHTVDKAVKGALDIASFPIK